MGLFNRKKKKENPVREAQPEFYIDKDFMEHLDEKSGEEVLSEYERLMAQAASLHQQMAELKTRNETSENDAPEDNRDLEGAQPEHQPGKVTDESVDNIITLTDENGQPIQFEFLDLIEDGGKRYVVLYNIMENDGSVTILELTECPDDDSKESYLPTDDATTNRIFKIFYEKHKDELEFDI